MISGNTRTPLASLRASAPPLCFSLNRWRILSTLASIACAVAALDTLGATKLPRRRKHMAQATFLAHVLCARIAATSAPVHHPAAHPTLQTSNSRRHMPAAWAAVAYNKWIVLPPESLPVNPEFPL